MIKKRQTLIVKLEYLTLINLSFFFQCTSKYPRYFLKGTKKKNTITLVISY